jgi:hypothetical protein
MPHDYLTIQEIDHEQICDGELYAAAMSRVLTNYLAAGLTADDVLEDWVQGFTITASFAMPASCL